MNTLISPHEKKLLKKTRRLPMILDECGKTDQEIYNRLVSLGYIENIDGYLFITEKGRAVLSDRRYAIITDWAPIFISVAAFITSVIALLK